MKRGFTLIEMLIVVAVIVALMTIAFRLSSIGNDQQLRAVTVARMQRLENCLSGYMAAFGSYPPVRVYGSRDIYAVDASDSTKDGQQNTAIWSWDADRFRTYVDSGYDSSYYQDAEARAWRQVRNACLAQPVACNFPFVDADNDRVNNLSQICQELANDSSEKEYDREAYRAGFDNLISSGHIGQLKNEGADWRDTKLFRFGLMSFLLPRYVIMLSEGLDDYDWIFRHEQWTRDNAQLSDPYTGNTLTYKTVLNKVANIYNSDGSINKNNQNTIRFMPSQAACIRWLPNLQGICSCNRSGWEIFGINISDGYSGIFPNDNGKPSSQIEVFKTKGGDYYVLDSVGVIDGWWNTFYYYSPAPYQSYVIWSSGKNGRTFPPWVDREALDSAANKCVGAWVEDDIIHMKN